MSSQTNRRTFLQSSAVATTGFWVAGGAAMAQSRSPNEKLNIASVGAGGRASSDIGACSSENIVALCDVDERRAAKTFNRYPKAKQYKDYRKMLEQEKNNVDAVIVATPDHSHAPASLLAMSLGKHVYCEKPLTKTVYEARLMAEVAAEKGLATQMGNQGTSGDGLRRATDWIRAGVLGEVREVHVWTNRPVWPQGYDAILKHKGIQAALHGKGESASAPAYLDWDLWLGPAAKRPYDPIYAPFTWRGWWDYGTGALGDMACHTANLPFMALNLGAPTSVEADVSDFNPETYATWAVIQYEFPARGDLPPVSYTWYDGGGRKPKKAIDKLTEVVQGEKVSGSGCAIVGSKGTLYSRDDYGQRYKLLPENRFKDFNPPPSKLPKSPGHHAEWIRACKGGEPAMSNFSHAGPFTEMVLLGNVATAVRKKIEWDSKNLKARNMPEADEFIRPMYRNGWELPSLA